MNAEETSGTPYFTGTRMSHSSPVTSSRPASHRPWMTQVRSILFDPDVCYRLFYYWRWFSFSLSTKVRGRGKEIMDREWGEWRKGGFFVMDTAGGGWCFILLLYYCCYGCWTFNWAHYRVKVDHARGNLSMELFLRPFIPQCSTIKLCFE